MHLKNPTNVAIHSHRPLKHFLDKNLIFIQNSMHVALSIFPTSLIYSYHFKFADVKWIWPEQEKKKHLSLSLFFFYRWNRFESLLWCHLCFGISLTKSDNQLIRIWKKMVSVEISSNFDDLYIFVTHHWSLTMISVWKSFSSCSLLKRCSKHNKSIFRRSIDVTCSW